jgi:hypothetical protein
MFIANPFAGSRMLALFSTHPPVAERITRLIALERKGDRALEGISRTTIAVVAMLISLVWSLI